MITALDQLHLQSRRAMIISAITPTMTLIAFVAHVSPKAVSLWSEPFTPINARMP